MVALMLVELAFMVYIGNSWDSVLIFKNGFTLNIDKQLSQKKY